MREVEDRSLYLTNPYCIYAFLLWCVFAHSRLRADTQAHCRLYRVEKGGKFGYSFSMFKKTGHYRDGIYIFVDVEMPVYGIKGRKNYLVDSVFTFLAPKILEDLERENFVPDYLLLTHSHYDHLGSAPILRKRFPHMKIVASKRTAEILEKPRAIELIKALEKEAEQIFGEESPYEFEAFPVDITVGEGDRVEEFEVIETPGHTRCSVSFIFPEKRIIFVGDAAGVEEEGGYIRPQFLSSYSAYLDSLKKILRYSHLDLAMGHGGIFQGPEAEEFLKRSIRRTEEFRREIEELYKKTGDPEKVAELIYEKEYIGMGIKQPREAYMINLKAMIKAVLKESALA